VRTRNANERRSPNPSGRALLSRNECSRERVGRGARLVPAIQGWIYLFARLGGLGIDSVSLPPHAAEGGRKGWGVTRPITNPGPRRPDAVKRAIVRRETGVLRTPYERAAPLRFAPSGDDAGQMWLSAGMNFGDETPLKAGFVTNAHKTAEARAGVTPSTTPAVQVGTCVSASLCPAPIEAVSLRFSAPER
jgi:hypothetical protein